MQSGKAVVAAAVTTAYMHMMRVRLSCATYLMLTSLRKPKLGNTIGIYFSSILFFLRDVSIKYVMHDILYRNAYAATVAFAAMQQSFCRLPRLRVIRLRFNIDDCNAYLNA